MTEDRKDLIIGSGIFLAVCLMVYARVTWLM